MRLSFLAISIREGSMDRRLRLRSAGARGAVTLLAVALLATGCVSKKAFVARSHELDQATAPAASR